MQAQQPNPVSIDRSVLEALLDHAVFAARLAGHLDDGARAHIVSALANHVDTVVHGLSEVLGASRRATAALDVEAPSESVAHDEAPMLTAAVDGVP